jgi:hypothetical protein
VKNLVDGRSYFVSLAELWLRAIAVVRYDTGLRHSGEANIWSDTQLGPADEVRARIDANRGGAAAAFQIASTGFGVLRRSFFSGLE